VKSVALPVLELIGGSQKLGAVPGYAYALYTPKSYMYVYTCHSDYLCICTRFPAIFDMSFGWGLRTSDLGKGVGVGGRGWYRPKERW